MESGSFVGGATSGASPVGRSLVPLPAISGDLLKRPFGVSRNYWSMSTQIGEVAWAAVFQISAASVLDSSGLSLGSTDPPSSL